ncbi:hypothetical protein [Streptomyces sp. NPDC046939]|uniref:hypothetical protein n=1 Tax=Streptomyces sp. NPDC046939 TaxID=3155376 RepID=UPI00340686EF
MDVHLPGSRRRLRFQLGDLDHRAWRRADDELAADADGIDWIFASEGPVIQQVLGRNGYCLRVRCETVGGERRVHIGAEARDRTVDWTPLEDCALTPGGIVTPHVERIRLSRPRPEPVAFPLQGGWTFALVSDAESPADSPFSAEDRHLLVADVKPVDSPIVRGLVSLPGDTEAPSAEHVYRVPDGGRILVGDDGPGWAVEANRYVRLNAHEAQRTGLWTPPSVLGPEAVTPEHVSRTVRSVLSPAKARSERDIAFPAGKRSGFDREVPTVREQLTRPELVTALRDALANHARLHSTTTWETLARTVSSELERYSHTDRRYLLVEVDSPLREHAPILSALIREGDGPLPYLSNVLSQLGVAYAGPSTRIKRWAAVETERAFAAYGTPRRTMPSRFSLQPEQPPLKRRTAVGTTTNRAKSPKSQRVPDRRIAVADARGRASAKDTGEVRHLRALAVEATDLLRGLDKPTRKRVRKILAEAQTWLAHHDGYRLSTVQSQRAAGRSAHHHVRLL